jgi:hypothetical protein
VVAITSLLVPIVVSAVIVFIASSVIHMVLKYHANDVIALPNEKGAMDALRPLNIPPGNYVMPKAGSMKEMGSPEYVEKLKQGPVALLTVMPSGPFSMGKPLALWFIYSLVISLFAAYVAGRALGPGADYLDVFRFAGTAAFLGYGAAQWQETIWFNRSLTTTLKNNFDALVYALLTAGTFGWLWPN